MFAWVLMLSSVSVPFAGWLAGSLAGSWESGSSQTGSQSLQTGSVTFPFGSLPKKWFWSSSNLTFLLFWLFCFAQQRKRKQEKKSRQKSEQVQSSLFFPGNYFKFQTNSDYLVFWPNFRHIHLSFHFVKSQIIILFTCGFCMQIHLDENRYPTKYDLAM